MIKESNSDNNLAPQLMVGEMERRIGRIYDSSKQEDRYYLLASVNNTVDDVFKPFSLLSKETKQLIIKKLT